MSALVFALSIPLWIYLFAGFMGVRDGHSATTSMARVLGAIIGLLLLLVAAGREYALHAIASGVFVLLAHTIRFVILRAMLPSKH